MMNIESTVAAIELLNKVRAQIHRTEGAGLASGILYRAVIKLENEAKHYLTGDKS